MLTDQDSGRTENDRTHIGMTLDRVECDDGTAHAMSEEVDWSFGPLAKVVEQAVEIVEVIAEPIDIDARAARLTMPSQIQACSIESVLMEQFGEELVASGVFGESVHDHDGTAGRFRAIPIANEEVRLV